MPPLILKMPSLEEFTARLREMAGSLYPLELCNTAHAAMNLWLSGQFDTGAYIPDKLSSQTRHAVHVSWYWQDGEQYVTLWTR